jgi:hypothetical protein
MCEVEGIQARDPNVCVFCASFLDLADWYKETREVALSVTVPHPTPQVGSC